MSNPRGAQDSDAAKEGGAWSRPDLRLLLEAMRELEEPDPLGTIEEHATLEVLDVVGQGGMGTIHAARDPNLGRVVAMKVMRGTDASSSTLKTHRPFNRRMLKRFLREARITAQLDHPGILPVYELGLGESGQVYFTMPLVSGKRLGEIFEQTRRAQEGWSVPRALSHIIRICETLAFAHERGVVHRDLKPDNVIVGPFGETFVLDWGLAKVVGEVAEEATQDAGSEEIGDEPSPDVNLESWASSLTISGVELGTAGYMAPEQAAGEHKRVGVCSDVYSLGAILYTLLAGHAPYRDSGPEPSRDEIVQRTRAGPPVPIATLAFDQPLELCAICEKAMSRRIEDRYASMLEFRSDLQAFLDGRVVRAHRTGALAELRSWVKRHRVQAIAGALFATISVIVLILLSERRRKKAEHEMFLALYTLLLVEELVARQEQFWPPRPQEVEQYEKWLEERESLLELQGPLERIQRALNRGNVFAQERQELNRAEESARTRIAAALEQLERLADLDNETTASVRKRLHFAREVGPITLTGELARARWTEAIASIRDDCPAYDGLEIVPQLGLLPLGQDPESKLWEFGHLLSGKLPQRDSQTGRLIVGEETGLVFILVPPGTLLMGSQGDDPASQSYDPDQKATSLTAPVHEVPLEAFFLSKYEMTQAQWQRFTGSNPSFFPPGSDVGPSLSVSLLHPVEQVSWDDATKTLTKMGLALPAEAQWEYACRAGTGMRWFTGDDSSSLQGYGNFGDRITKEFVEGLGQPNSIWGFSPELTDGYMAPSPIGVFLPNPWGFHDIIGNVQEWCQDLFYSYKATTVAPGTGLREPGKEGQGTRVTRGGAYLNSAEAGKSAWRGKPNVSKGWFFVCLRPARQVDR